jgi:hypothetical protein
MKFGWSGNADRIALLAAHHEANGGSEGWKANEIVSKFSEARIPARGNFARDTSNAVKGG